jgi:hypothetical protein
MQVSTGGIKKLLDNPMQSSWSNGLRAIAALPRCGAKCRTRNGSPCRAIAMANGRCRMHGGANLGAPSGKKHGQYRHGLHTKEVIEKLKGYRASLARLKKIVSTL